MKTDKYGWAVGQTRKGRIIGGCDGDSECGVATFTVKEFEATVQNSEKDEPDLVEEYDITCLGCGLDWIFQSDWPNELVPTPPTQEEIEAEEFLLLTGAVLLEGANHG
jgi:hypothetical protein